MKYICIIFHFVFVPIIAFSQQYANEFEQTVTVNSTSSLNGYTRNIVEVPLPENTIGYVLRIATAQKGQSEISNNLFSLLKKIPASEISLTASLAQFAIRNSDGSSIDAFIFANAQDANDFYTKNDASWTSCKSMLNMVSSCFSYNSCLNRSIYFGFRNNNIMEGLDVTLEVVPIVDETNERKYTYTYSIWNVTGKNLKYFLSIDGLEWQSFSLSNSSVSLPSYNQGYIYFKIVTNGKAIQYKITANQRHKLIWSNDKSAWDLVNY